MTDSLQPKFIYKARCHNVVDGDTIDATIDLGLYVATNHRLRLARIDAPELNSKDPAIRLAADAAREFTRRACEGRDLVIETRKSDSFGRFLAEVWILDAAGQQRNLSDELLAAGLAQLYKRG